MCMITFHGANTSMPDEELLKIIWEENSDGGGLMYQVGEEVKCEKGFLMLEDFLDHYHSLLEQGTLSNDVNFAIHFRLGSFGWKYKEICTHPFRISSNIEDLQESAFTAMAALMHNGVITEFNDTTKYDLKSYTDTMLFICKKLGGGDWEKILHEASCSPKTKFSRFLLFDSGNWKMFGEWFHDSKTGLYYSKSNIEKFTGQLYGPDYFNNYISSEEFPERESDV